MEEGVVSTSQRTGIGEHPFDMVADRRRLLVDDDHDLVDTGGGQISDSTQSINGRPAISSRPLGVRASSTDRSRDRTPPRKCRPASGVPQMPRVVAPVMTARREVRDAVEHEVGRVAVGRAADRRQSRRFACRSTWRARCRGRADRRRSRSRSPPCPDERQRVAENRTSGFAAPKTCESTTAVSSAGVAELLAQRRAALPQAFDTTRELDATAGELAEDFSVDGRRHFRVGDEPIGDRAHRLPDRRHRSDSSCHRTWAATSSRSPASAIASPACERVFGVVECGGAFLVGRDDAGFGEETMKPLTPCAAAVERAAEIEQDRVERKHPARDTITAIGLIDGERLRRATLPRKTRGTLAAASARDRVALPHRLRGAVIIASANSSGFGGVAQQCGSVGHFEHCRDARSDHRAAGRHRFQDRQARILRSTKETRALSPPCISASRSVMRERVRRSRPARRRRAGRRAACSMATESPRPAITSRTSASAVGADREGADGSRHVLVRPRIADAEEVAALLGYDVRPGERNACGRRRGGPRATRCGFRRVVVQRSILAYDRRSR